MKIKLKNPKKQIRKGDTYGGFGSKVSAILNSGEIAEVDKIPEISKDLVKEVTKDELKAIEVAKVKAIEKAKAKEAKSKENNNG